MKAVKRRRRRPADAGIHKNLFKPLDRSERNGKLMNVADETAMLFGNQAAQYDAIDKQLSIPRVLRNWIGNAP